MSNTSHLDWPFFNDAHRELQTQLDYWASQHICQTHSKDVDQDFRDLVKQLGEAGWLKHAIAGKAYGANQEVIDTRAICLLRETLARYAG